jgi:enoyl-[acyl-carrier protein] reductase I
VFGREFRAGLQHLGDLSPRYRGIGSLACCRYLAYALGPKGIRVHAISPGPLKTRPVAGIKDFQLLLNEAEHRAPLGELVDIRDVGYSCWFLSTPYARRTSGATLYVDGGVNIMA